MSGSGISWAICKSAPHSRHDNHVNTPPLVFYRPDALPAAQPTASKHWRQKALNVLYVILYKSGILYHIFIDTCLYYCVLVTRIFKYCVVGIWPWRVCVSWQHPSSHMILSRNIRKLLSMLWRSAMLQYNTIRDVVLTCAQKLTWVSA